MKTKSHKIPESYRYFKIFFAEKYDRGDVNEKVFVKNTLQK